VHSVQNREEVRPIMDPTIPHPLIDAAFLLRWLATATEDIERETDRLTELDSPIGDADHGSNLRRGFIAARTALEKGPPDTPGGVLVATGRQLISTVGGASGPLYGTLLRSAGKTLGEASRVTPEQLSEALNAGVEAVSRLGGAVPGDATMIDALTPAVQALAFALDSGAGLAAALSAAALAADEGAEATVPLQARKGRASYLGERSIGHQDPGATSSALLVTALARTAGEGGP
jgi:phosphoenolpyruvate---glycerone phosphotransferase subunit DhaL